MKRLIVLLFVLSLSLHCINAQENDNKLHLDLSLGLACLSDNNFTPFGLVGALEAQLLQMNFLSMGVRAEVEFIGSNTLNLHNDIQHDIVSTRPVISISQILDIHFLKKNNFSIFVGGGYGWYSMPGIEVRYWDYLIYNEETNREQTWNWMCRAGVDINPIRVAIEYNPVGKNDNRSYEYIALKVGVRLF